MEIVNGWPYDYHAILKKRYRIAYQVREDRQMQIKLMAYYKTHPIEWINDWTFTFDPRLEGSKTIPFILFSKQRDFIKLLVECIQTRESALIEKCRDIGASWICVAFSVWLWLFHPGATIGWGSRKEEYVDKKGNPKAIFPKIRQLISKLPNWMMPAGFSMRDHATYMLILNPANGSTITGEAGDNIGRGGRTTIFFKDESAHYERPELIEAALSANTEVQIDISSVNGSGNVFYRRRMAGEVWEPGRIIERGVTRVFIFDWRDHPGKTQEWYDRTRKKFEAEGLLHIFAQEVDRDYSSALDKIIIRPEWVNASIDAHLKLNIPATGEKIAGQDIADEGGDKNALALRHGVILRYVNHWGGEAGEAPKISVPICIEHQINELFYDSVGVGSGFKTGSNNMKQIGAIPKSLRILPWSGGSKPQDEDQNIIIGDPQSPTNGDQYANLKAQSWFRLRTRFYKTYRFIVHGEFYPFDELISIPSTLERRQELQMELSQAVYKYNLSGKTLVDKVGEGARSPNLADAVVMCYNPLREDIGIFGINLN